MSRFFAWGVKAMLAVSALSLAPFAKPALAAPAAPTSGPSDVLTGKGLIKTGVFYLLPGEKEVADGMRPLAQTKKKFDDEAKTRVGLEKNIQMAKTAIADWDYQRRQLNTKLAGVTDATQNNHLVAQINVLTSKMDEGTKFQEENQQKLSGLGETTRTAYINQVLDLTSKADAIAKQYADLAADADVKAAATAAKGKLGPSQEFTFNASQLKKMRGTFSSDSVPVKHEDEVPTVEVTLNGKLTRSMVLDSGASMVSIPADLAKDLNLVPGADDPTIHLQLADGKVVEARQMTLKSVRVGTFTVEDVDCAILPPDLISAQPLLGGSFLKNFIYKLDPKAGELHLARIGGEDVKPAGAAGPPKPNDPKAMEKKPDPKAAPKPAAGGAK